MKIFNAHTLAKALMLLLLLMLSMPSLDAFGDSLPRFSDRSCKDFESGRDFVRASSMSCLSNSNSRNCMKQARSFFKQCRYAGNYESLRSKFSLEMLAVLFLGRGKAVPEQRRVEARKSAPILARNRGNEREKRA